MRRLIPAVLVFFLFVSVRTSAQAMPTAQKWENVEWYMVFSWQLVGADAEAAMDIFVDHAWPVMQEVWPEMTCLRMMTGEWSITCFGPMMEGLAALEWQTAPQMARFMSLFAQREGEAAVEMIETFGSAIARMDNNIALKHVGGR